MNIRFVSSFPFRLMLLVIPILLLTTFSLHAQDVTADDVNGVASKMYCPTCENIPLDDCGTATCQDWKAEIQSRLLAGESEQAIINSFVARFGENVVGVPQDPLLRILSLLTPLFIIGIVLGFAVYIFSVWRRSNQQLPGTPNSVPDVNDLITDDEYRLQLERDLQERG